MSVQPGTAPASAGPSQQSQDPNQTMTQWFKTLNLIAWFNLTPTQYFGQNSELGEDFGMPANSPVGSATSGKVVAVQADPTGSSVGYVVQVEDPHGAVWHYQHLRSPNAKVGDPVFPGQIIGWSGGCPSGGYNANNPHVCSFYDRFSTNPHIEVRYAPQYNPNAGVWNQHWTNPQSVFQGVGNTTISGQVRGGPYDPNSSSAASGNCTHSITLPALPGGAPATICMDPGIDLLARAAMILLAFFLVLTALYIFTHDNSTVQQAAQNAQSDMAGKVKKAMDVAALAGA